MPKRAASIVVLDVKLIKAEGRLDEDEALLQLFAFTDRVTMKSGSATHYVSGNYDLVDEDEDEDEDEDGGRRVSMWLGELMSVKTVEAIRVSRDPEKGNVISSVESEGTDVPELHVYFAYVPDEHILLMTERGGFPYTRMQTYVKRAGGDRIRVSLTPRPTDLSVWGHIDLFDRVFRISTRLRHSQSPGDEFFDRVIETLDADHIVESIVAPKGGELNIAALKQDSSLPQNRSLNHLEQNDNNGSAKIAGEIGGELMEVNTADPVERHRAELDYLERTSVSRALAGIIRGLR